MMSILRSATDAVISGNGHCINNFLHLSNFGLIFEPCCWFFEHGGQNSNLDRTYILFTFAGGDLVWTYGLN